MAPVITIPLSGTPENWHHPRFMVDESVIHQGSALFAQVVLDALEALKA